MAKFYDAVGYVHDGEAVENPPGSGVFVANIVEKAYYGDVIRNTRRIQEGDNLNPDLTVNNSISIVADAYANEHFFAIRYVRWQGAAWTVSDVEVQPPRLILRLGGVWHGPVAETDSPGPT